MYMCIVFSYGLKKVYTCKYFMYHITVCERLFSSVSSLFSFIRCMTFSEKKWENYVHWNWAKTVTHFVTQHPCMNITNVIKKDRKSELILVNYFFFARRNITLCSNHYTRIISIFHCYKIKQNGHSWSWKKLFC